MKNDTKTRKMPKGKEFSSEYQPESNGRPKGSVSLDTRIRNLLNDTDNLPEPLKEAIRKKCGGNKSAIDAMMIVGMLHALQGDKGWAEFITNRGWGKVVDKTEVSGPDGAAVPLEINVKFGK